MDVKKICYILLPTYLLCIYKFNCQNHVIGIKLYSLTYHDFRGESNCFVSLPYKIMFTRESYVNFYPETQLLF